ncbi:MAG: PhoX family phosphatase [Caulobacterales bacterium]|nr:PhoX family phosphatase [Caulobacterales bacterium]
MMTKSVNRVNFARELDDSENVSSNSSDNRDFADVVAVAMSRRSVLQGTLAGAAAGFLTPAAGGFFAPQAVASDGDLVGFKPLALADAIVDATMPSISDDYEYQVLIPWGTPIRPGATTAFDGEPTARPTSEQAALQVGIGHDGMAFFPADSRDTVFGRYAHYFGNDDYRERMSSTAGFLCVNNEFGTNPHVLGKDAPESLEDVRVSQAVHGVTVVAIEEKGEVWELVDSPNARRVTVNTPVAFSGPAAGSPLLDNRAGNIPMGTVNNCGSGPTPWGTYLTCEENFNGYFGATAGLTNPTEAQARYGFSDSGFGYGWELFDKRFDLSDPDYVNEANRFGWVVEIDPFDPTAMPVKRTALGRFKHEAVAIGISGDDRIAAYMGDDQRGDYFYKYVSDQSWKEAIRDDINPLDEGKLYVAKFNDDNTGEWLELTVSNPTLGARFADQAELLINTRIAADLLGATKMDRPEWTTVGQDYSVFLTLTNNNRKDDGQGEVNAVNPENPNNDGHIIKVTDEDEFLGTSFVWEIYILSSSTRGTEGVFTDPDAAHADPFGRLFIGTDGGQPDGLQDQLVVFDTTADTPEPKRLLTGVAGDEITGWAYTPNRRTAFVNIQHPGNGDPSVTNFPDRFNGRTIPRDCTLVIRRKDGGVIGS